MIQAPASPATARELALIESWRDCGPRLACYLGLIEYRRWPADVDVEALRRACEVALGRRKVLGEAKEANG